MSAIYAKNRLPSPKIAHKTPFEIVYNIKTSVKHMRVLGCQAYILTPKEKRLKWDPKARAGVFLGYEEVFKAYRVYDIEAKQVVISRDVNFDESTFGFVPSLAYKDVEDLDLEPLNLADNDLRPMQFQQAGKRKSRPHDEEEDATSRPRTVRPRPGLEEASAPEYRSPRPADADEEEKSGGLHETPPSPVF